MRDIRPLGPYKDVILAPSPENKNAMVSLGVRKVTFQIYAERGVRSAIAQYYALVQEGMTLAQHVFRGLKRPLMLGENTNADENVFVYSWRSSLDSEWTGSKNSGRAVVIPDPPVGRVFVVLVREELPNNHGIVGSIERWNWVREDPILPHAPVDWQDRYREKVWSKES